MIMMTGHQYESTSVEAARNYGYGDRVRFVLAVLACTSITINDLKIQSKKDNEL